MAEKTVDEVSLKWAYRLLGACPVVLVSTNDGKKDNAATVAWCAPCEMEPPKVMLALATEHKSAHDIRTTGEFALNIPTLPNLDLVMYCGSVSGHDVDKLAVRGIAVRRGHKLARLPLLEDCAAWLECKVDSAEKWDEHGIVIAHVVHASMRRGVLDSDHSWNCARFPLLHHLGGKKFVVGERVVSG